MHVDPILISTLSALQVYSGKQKKPILFILLGYTDSLHTHFLQVVWGKRLRPP
jgi:hypothetical protein